MSNPIELQLQFELCNFVSVSNVEKFGAKYKMLNEVRM